MELATYANIIGILELLIGIPFIVAPRKTAAFMNRFMDDDNSMRMLSGFMVVISLLVLMQGATIGTDAAGLVRLLAWVVVFKHVLLCWHKDFVMGMMKRSWLDSSSFCVFIGIVACAIGVLLLYAGTIL